MCDLEAEVERLREQSARRAELLEIAHAEAVIQGREVERLQENNALVTQEALDAKAEVERLRADQQTYADTYARNMARVNAEVKRLRDALRLTEAERDSWYGTVEKIEAEVERLRRER